MEAIEIFTMALGLQEPWYVTKAELHIWIYFTTGKLELAYPHDSL